MFEKTILFGLLISFCAATQAASPRSVAQALHCEHLLNPQGVERKQPRLSWQMQAVAGAHDQATTAYRVLVASSSSLLSQDRGDLWDSGKIIGPQPVTVAYAGKPLTGLSTCWWKVKIWDENKREQSWSDPAHWSMGILDESEWSGDWIGYQAPLPPDPFRGEWFDQARWIWHADDDEKNPPDETRFFRRVFTINEKHNPQRAQMICTANDAMQLWVNRSLLTPQKIVFDGADSIPRFDLRPFLKSGVNEILVVAEKFKPVFSLVSIRPVAGLIAVIKIDTTTILTDNQWQCSKTLTGPWSAAADLAPASSHWRHMPGWRQLHPSPIFRKTFVAKKRVREAQVAISGLGYYELYCNSGRVGDHCLDPLFTNYDHRVSYVCYDITKQVQTGDNVLAVMLGNGWYNMHTRATWDFDRAPWRDEPKARVLLQLVYDDGSKEVIVSDKTWRANTGPVLFDGIHNGEVYDARLEREGWTQVGYDDRQWPQVEIVKAPKGRLTSQIMPAMKVMETITPVKITEPDKGVFVADMGCNMAGWARIQVRGPAGARIRLRFSERMDAMGRVNQKSNSRYMFQGPFQTDEYILKGKGLETWEPRFTHHGFRYVQITGWPGKPSAEQITGCVVHTAFNHTGQFFCSDTLLNAIAAMTDRSYCSNFVGYPTDCPQREKNGWTGDAHLAMEQAMYNYDNISSYESFCRELSDQRTAEGDLPGIVPTGGWGYHPDNGPGWGSAAVIIPWYLYLYTGDVQILADHYHLMKGYVDFLHGRFPDHVVEMCRGDWVYLHTKTPPRVTSTALYYYDAGIVAQAAMLLHKTEQAQQYQNLADEIKAVFNQRFFRGQGWYEPGSQTSLAMALYYGLTPEQEKEAVARTCADAVHKAKDHIDCGFLGMKVLFQALSENGYHGLAYQVATQRDFPGYGDWISRGATTLWEDWTDTEGSLNHVALGDIVTWFYRSLAGINVDPQQPGFRRLVIRPRPAAGLTFVQSHVETVFGRIACDWKIVSGQFTLNLTVPPNSTALVEMPDGTTRTVGSGTFAFSCRYNE